MNISHWLKHEAAGEKNKQFVRRERYPGTPILRGGGGGGAGEREQGIRREEERKAFYC